MWAAKANLCVVGRIERNYRRIGCSTPSSSVCVWNQPERMLSSLTSLIKGYFKILLFVFLTLYQNKTVSFLTPYSRITTFWNSNDGSIFSRHPKSKTTGNMAEAGEAVASGKGSAPAAEDLPGWYNYVTALFIPIRCPHFSALSHCSFCRRWWKYH